MTINFEVVHKDIMGRVGKLRVGDKIMRTPALLPVINPHLQIISPSEMQEMGIEALITNAYIFHKSEEFRERALNEGLHAILDFDGIIMTDSGSFQLSVYGEVEVDNQTTLEFQKAIGSEIRVPLDIPTSPDVDRQTAEGDLSVTFERIREAKELFGTGNIAAPVQGGAFTDFRERAGREVSGMGFSFCPIGAVVPLMEQYRYKELVKIILAAKRGLSPSACVHLFGAGHPSMFALSVAMGCDLFDSAAYALYAKEGRYMTNYGGHRINELYELPCACPVCRSHSADELNASKDRERLLALHNLYVAVAEIARIRQSVIEGTLWDLVDERCRSHPLLLNGYRELLKHAEELERHDRISKRRFFYRGSESCRRPEIIRYQNMVGRIPMSGRILVSFSGNRRDGYDRTLFFRPPFGPCPPELDETGPVGQIEVPDWDDIMVRTGCRGIRKVIDANSSIDIEIECGDEWAGIVKEELPGVMVI